MRPIPLKQRQEMEKLPFFHICAKAGIGEHVCDGKITWDHPLTFGGRQIIDANFTVPLCEYAHSVNRHKDGGDYVKELSVWIALNRATDDELRKFSKAVNYVREKARLNAIYGPFDEAKAISGYVLRKGTLNQSAAPQKEKPFWFPVKDDLKKKIQECMEFHKEIYDEHFKPFQMIEAMIEDYYNKIQVTKKENDYGR